MKREVKIIKNYDLNDLTLEVNQFLDQGWRVFKNLVVAEETYYLMLTRRIK